MYYRKALSYDASQYRELLHAVEKDGDSNAYQKLVEINEALSKEANLRLKRLEDHNYTDYSYKGAKSFLKTKYKDDRYPLDITDAREMYENILSAAYFLRKKTSTLSGYRDAEKKRMRTFRDILHLHNRTWEKDYITNKTLEKFLRLLGESPIRKVIDNLHKNGSKELVELLNGRFQMDDGATAEVIKLFEQFLVTESDDKAVKLEHRVRYSDLEEYLKTGKLREELKLSQIMKL